MSQIPNFVKQYAADLNRAALCQNAGRQVPPDLLGRIKTLEFRAQQVLSPSQIQDAMAHVNDMRLEDAQGRIADQQGYDNAMIDAVVERDQGALLHDMGGGEKGLSTSQYAVAAKTGKYPEINSAKKTLKTVSDMKETMSRKLNRSWDSIQDDLDELFVIGEDEARFKRALELGIDPLDADTWKERGVEIGLAEKRLAGAETEPDVENTAFTDYQQRKSDVIEATIDNAPGALVGSSTEQFNEDLQEDTRHGDFARAFEQHERQDLEEAVTS